MNSLLRAPSFPQSPLALPFESETLVECLTFRVGEGIFALPLQTIREILVPPSITFVPRAARAILGVISVRGQLVTVFDLRRKLRVGAAIAPVRPRILLVHLPTTEENLGVYVDDVMQVHRFAETEIETTGGLLGNHIAEWIVGLLHHDGQLITLLALAPLVEIEP